MPDFPGQTMAFRNVITITPMSDTSLVQEGFTIDGKNYGAGAVWPAANRAIYLPFLVDQTVSAQQMFVEVVTQSGNMDVGIYTEHGARLVSMGSTAVGAAGLQTFNIADTTLTPALYYAAMCVDNGTASFMRATPLAITIQTYGAQQQAVGAVTLPDPATFANPASPYMPMLGVALTATM